MKSIPALAYEQHIAILGRTGSGKTYTGKGIVETLLDSERQVCVIDPTSAWWGLRLKRDGKSKAYPVVLIGGDRGDIPLNERSGGVVARLVTQQRASVVIDTGDMTVGEYTRWFTEFAIALYSTIRNPLHLVIDEAHQFMPQGKVPNPEAGKMLHAGNRLMGGGRSRGIRAMLITQRPAKLHKDSLTCAATLIAKCVIAPQDRQAVKDWIDGAADPAKSKTVLDSLAGLSKREGWVWFPEGEFLERLTFAEIKTYDSSKTPEHGAANAPKPGEIDLSEVRAAMAEAVAEAEANDPKLLRSKIADLKRQLAAKPPEPTVAKPDPAVTERAVARATQARDEHWTRIVAGFERRLRKMTEITHDHAGSMGSLAAEMNAATIIKVNIPDSPAVRESMRSLAAEPTPREMFAVSKVTTNGSARHSASTPSGGIGKGERATLIAIAQHPAGVTREQLTILTGYKRSSRDTFLQRLRAGNLIDGSDTISATTEGVEALGGDFRPLPTGDALRAHWLGKLSGGERVVFETVCRAYPSAIKKSDIDSQTDYQRSSRDTFLQRLSARKLIRNAQGGVIASEELFGE